MSRTLMRSIPPIEGKRVLIVEDEALIAWDLQLSVEQQGGVAIGPAGSLAEARCLVRNGPVDAALLDIRVRDGEIFPLADELSASGVPFAFLSGLESAWLPERYQGFPLLSKPFDSYAVNRILASLTGGIAMRECCAN
jgi:DNA-binding response OmpR family regulator